MAKPADTPKADPSVRTLHVEFYDVGPNGERTLAGSCAVAVADQWSMYEKMVEARTALLRVKRERQGELL